LENGISPISLEFELSDPYFWDLYISADNKHAHIIDVMRIISKLNQYCANVEGESNLNNDEMHIVFQKLIKFAVKSKVMLI
jgi:hypothetical protein